MRVRCRASRRRDDLVARVVAFIEHRNATATRSRSTAPNAPHDTRSTNFCAGSIRKLSPVARSGGDWAAERHLGPGGCRPLRSRPHCCARARSRHANRTLQTAIGRARQAGLLGENVMGHGLLRHRGVPGGGGVHLRGRDRHLQLDRGSPRRAPEQAPVPRRSRPVRPANAREQRGDAGERAPRSCSGAGPRTQRSARRTRRERSCSVCRARSLDQVCTRCRSGSRWGICSTWPAGCGPGPVPASGAPRGGAAGMFVGPEALDVPLTFEATRAAGATLGSGVVLVLDDTVELVPFLLRIAEFFRDESCGQCVPCRVGTVRGRRGASPARERRWRRRSDPARRGGPGDEGRVDLRTRSNRLQRHRIGHHPSGAFS